jgi:hypothetical protein
MRVGIWHVGLVQLSRRTSSTAEGIVVALQGVASWWRRPSPCYAQALADLDVTALYTQQVG